MDAIKMLKERRSIRNFKDEKVHRNLIKEIVSTSIFAPSWANTQIARYTVVDDKEIMERLGKEVFMGFKFNEKILSNAAGVVVLSYVKGKSGYGPKGNFATVKGSSWEMFDAGIAAQTFCLAAYEKGVGTVILGIFDENKVAEIIDLPEDEVVASLIPYGFEKDHPKAPKRNSVEDILRFK